MWTDKNTLVLLLPEILLIAMATWIFVAGTISKSRTWWSLFSIATYVVAGLVLMTAESSLWSELSTQGLQSPQGPLAIDLFGHLIRWLSLGCGVFFTLIASRTASRNWSSEHFGTIMVLVAGMMFSARANELVFLFVSLEMVSIPTYVLLYLGRSDRAAAEAAAKYFYLSVLSSAVLLYGLSFIYGISGVSLISGTDQVPGIREVLADKSAAGESVGALATIAVVLVLAGLGFKLAAVPFHFYAPDVYQGVSNANAGILAVAPKITGMVALVRLMTSLAPQAPFAWQLVMVLAILTMTIGNVCALWQKNIRRLMAYSSIAHSGYLLVGISVGLAFERHLDGAGGISASLFYLYVYVLASIGVFAALTWLGSEHRQISNLEELSGLGRTRPWGAAVLATSMFSLAGIPPLAGFWGKLTLFTGAMNLAVGAQSSVLGSWFLLLAIIGALNAAVAAAYYLRVVGVLYFQPSLSVLPAEGGVGAWLAAAGAALLVITIGLSPGLALQHTGQAEKAFLLRGHALSQSPSIQDEIKTAQR